MHFQISLSLWEVQVIRDWLCVRNFAETSLNKLLLFLILKSNQRRYSVEKGVLKNFTGKYLCWSLFLIKLQPLRLSTEICKIFKNTYKCISCKSLFTVHEKGILTRCNEENFEKTVKFLALNYFLKEILS